MADPVDGQLVGETSDRVYLTATSADRIVSLSRDESKRRRPGPSS